MAGLGDTLADILSGAPELIDNPGLVVGLARGALAPQSGAVDGRAIGALAATAAMNQGIHRALADFQAIDDGGEH